MEVLINRLMMPSNASETELKLISPALGTYNQASFREAVWKGMNLLRTNCWFLDTICLRKAFNENTKKI
jgi:hypothetical protein